jgi:hypothetical protein
MAVALTWAERNSCSARYECLDAFVTIHNTGVCKAHSTAPSCAPAYHERQVGARSQPRERHALHVIDVVRARHVETQSIRQRVPVGQSAQVICYSCCAG